MTTGTITNGVLSKQTGSKDREDTGGVSSSKPTGGYYSDPDFEAHFKKDTDWFSTYISHLRKRRRKAVRGSGLAGDEESDDDRSLIGGARSAFEKPKRKTFYEQQLDSKSKSKVKEVAPDKYWTYFRNFDSKEGTGPSPNEGKYVESSRKTLAEERENFQTQRASHSVKDLYGAEDYYRSGRDVLYRIWQERENLKEKDKQLRQELGYDERENEYSVPRLVHQSREQTLRYTTPLHNPNTQNLIRSYVTAGAANDPVSRPPLSGINRTLASAPNASRYTAGSGAPQNATGGSHRVEDRSLAPSQKPFDIPDPEDTENRGSYNRSSNMMKEKLDSQSRKMENLYDTIRSLEKEKAQQEATLQEIREDMRQMRDRLEQQHHRGTREYESTVTQSAAAVAQEQSQKQMEAFKKDFLEMFTKMQHQINNINSQQTRPSKSDEMITSLVSDIGDIKKLFREEVTSLKQNMEEVRSQSRKMASTFDSTNAQMHDFNRKLQLMDKRCDELTERNSKLIRDSLKRDAMEGYLQGTASGGAAGASGDVTGVGGTKQSFEIQDMRTALMHLDDRVKKFENVQSTSLYREKPDYPTTSLTVDLDLPDKPSGSEAMKDGSYSNQLDDTLKAGKYEPKYDSKYDSKYDFNDPTKTLDSKTKNPLDSFNNYSKWATKPLTPDVDLELVSGTGGCSSRYETDGDPFQTPGREGGLPEGGSTTAPETARSAEELLILTEEMDDIGDLSISGVGSLDDLSTF